MLLPAWVSAGLFIAALLGPLCTFIIYPAGIFILSLFAGKWKPIEPVRETEFPTISLLVAVRNGTALIARKVKDTFEQNYPGEKLEIIVFSDGSTDDTMSILDAIDDPRLRVMCSDKHIGKAAALNRAAEQANGEILVFTDADAILAPDALSSLVRHFSDPEVGGVCGQRRIARGSDGLREAQSRYIEFDSLIKRAESRTGSISSNDGKLYAIRAALFTPIDPAATDDLYTALATVRQGKRFVFEPRAVAAITKPSRDVAHELSRRRRVVCRSLHGIWMNRVLLNPFRFGFFSLELLANKIVRRLLPFCLILLLISTILLCFVHPFFVLVMVAQLSLYTLALSYPYMARPLPKAFEPVQRAASTACYFCAGNLGTLLGVLDFLQGRKIDKWTPKK